MAMVVVRKRKGRRGKDSWEVRRLSERGRGGGRMVMNDERRGERNSREQCNIYLVFLGFDASISMLDSSNTSLTSSINHLYKFIPIHHQIKALAEK